jgi:hypothetical protein
MHQTIKFVHCSSTGLYINNLLYFWLGASDVAVPDTWIWGDGTPVDSSYWKSGEPNDQNGIEMYGLFDNTLKMYDLPWSQNFNAGTPFWPLCQIDV